MLSKNSILSIYLRHSLVILLRYQHVYFYVIVIAGIILLPRMFNINEKYFSFLFSFNFIIVLWIFSPFYLNQFSFSSDDARSLSLFSLNFRDLIMVRNILNFSMLIITFILSIVLIRTFYSATDTSLSGLMLISAMHLLPAISVGNLTSRSSVSWTAKFPMSWKSSYVIFIAFFNILVFKFSQQVFNGTIFISVLITLFLLYLALYILSFRKIVRELTTYFCSIAEK